MQQINAGTCRRPRGFWQAVIGVVLLGAAQWVGGGETGGLVLVNDALHADRPVREPMVVQHPSGDLFLAGYRRSMDPNMPPQLWRSQDAGTSWQQLDVGSVDEDARGNSDVDLAVGPNGTLYLVVMGYDRVALEGTHIVIGVSRDRGDSWSWTTLAQARNSDRPWVEVAPDGVAHVIWNDGEGVRYVTSEDRGRNWAEQSRIHDKGGSSHFAIGPDGELAVRIIPISAAARQFHPGVDLLAVSTDGGDNWTQRYIPEELEWSDSLGQDGKPARWVEPVAWDDDGHLFYLWSSGNTLKLARSDDLGASWISWDVLTEDEPAYFPYLIARNSGELAATWFVGRGDSLSVRVVHLSGAATGKDQPQLRTASLFQQAAWLEQAGRETRDTGGEYLPALWLNDSQLAVVTVAQHGNGDTIDAAPVSRVTGGEGRAEVPRRQGFSWRVYELAN